MYHTSLANAKFIHGTDKELEIVTGQSKGDGFRISQAMLVEINDAEGMFKAHLITDGVNTLESALEKLHWFSMKLVYEKLAKGLKADAKLATGEVDIDGELEWK